MLSLSTHHLKRALAGALALLPLLSHAQNTAVLTGRVSGRVADTVMVSLRENPLEAREKSFPRGAQRERRVQALLFR